MASCANHLPIGIDDGMQVEIPSRTVDEEPIDRVGVEEKIFDAVDSLNEPLIPRANNVKHLARKNYDYLRDSTRPTSEGDNDAENDYIRLIDDDAVDADDADPGSNSTEFGDNRNEVNVLDSRRFGILAIFCLNNLMGSAIWITFASIEDAVKAKFRHHNDAMYDDGSSYSGISDQQINWLAMIGMAVYGPGTALCAWVVPKFGFRETVIASSFVMAIGCIFRWFGLGFLLQNVKVGRNETLIAKLPYTFLLTGQGLVAVGQIIFMNAPARVAATWFQQTTKVIGAINLFSSVGLVLGQVLSPLCVTEETGEHLDQLLAAQGVVMGLCTLFTWYFFRYEEPACPPSAAESIRRRERQRQYDSHISTLSTTSTLIFKDVEKLLTNPQYIVLTVAFAINYGLNSAIFTLMQPWLASSGFPGDDMAGLCGSLVTGGGVFATWIASILLDITRNFNQAIRWTFASTTIAGIGLVAALHPDCPIWILATAFAITGMTQMPLTTICFDAVAAHTYPVSEELSSAGLVMVGQYLGIILVDGMSSLIESISNDSDRNDGGDQSKYGFMAKTNIFYLSFLSFASALACCYDSDDVRANATDNREMLQDSGSQMREPIEEMHACGDDIDHHRRTIESSYVEIISDAP